MVDFLILSPSLCHTHTNHKDVQHFLSNKVELKEVYTYTHVSDIRDVHTIAFETA